MRILLDACVLYPSVLRDILMGCARGGLFTPLWSARILEEWRRAAERNGIGAEAAIEIALLQADWADAAVPENADLEAQLRLPDANDTHVLAAAIAGRADGILTANTGDFPIRVLGQHGLLRRHPDEFLLELARTAPGIVKPVLDAVHGRAGVDTPRRRMLKRAGVPRLAKWDAG